jgi:hypothetical protein
MRATFTLFEESAAAVSALWVVLDVCLKPDLRPESAAAKFSFFKEIM